MGRGGEVVREASGTSLACERHLSHGGKVAAPDTLAVAPQPRVTPPPPPPFSARLATFCMQGVYLSVLYTSADAAALEATRTPVVKAVCY